MQRRKKAFRRVAVLILVLLFIHFSGAYSLTPGQAADKYLRWHAARDMEQIMDLDEGYYIRYHLCANEQQLLLLRSDFELLRGWNTEKLYSIDGGSGAGMITVYYESGADYSLTFGGVDSPGAERLVLHKTEDTGEFIHALTPDEMLRQDGKIYFIKNVGMSSINYWFQFEKFQFLRVFGADGKLIEELPIEYASMNHD